MFEASKCYYLQLDSVTFVKWSTGHIDSEIVIT